MEQENRATLLPAEGEEQNPVVNSLKKEESGLGGALMQIAEGLSDEQVGLLSAQCNAKNLKKVFSDSELMRTANCYVRNSLNISAAARELYMHRNTMMYRLEKIKRLTSLDIKRFDDAAAFEILYVAFCRGRGESK